MAIKKLTPAEKIAKLEAQLAKAKGEVHVDKLDGLIAKMNLVQHVKAIKADVKGISNQTLLAAIAKAAKLTGVTIAAKAKKPMSEEQKAKIKAARLKKAVKK